jgi:hypothetical protein
MAAKQKEIVVRVKRRRRRWPLVLLGLVVFLVIVGALSGGHDKDRPSSSPSPSTASAGPQKTNAPTPNYSVIGKSDWRRDGQPIYYAVMDPVDLSDDGFKQNVKLVTQALAKSKGDANFSAHIFDDVAVARDAFASDPGGSGPPLDQTKAALDLRGQHLVAIYSGGLDASLYLYEIDWYPAAFTQTANIGKYVGSEEWKA